MANFSRTELRDLRFSCSGCDEVTSSVNSVCGRVELHCDFLNILLSIKCQANVFAFARLLVHALVHDDFSHRYSVDKIPG